MSLIQKIESIIIDGYKENVSGRVFELNEKGKHATCKKAMFEASGSVLVYKFDKKIKNISEDKLPFMKDGSGYDGLRAMCDFILFYNNNGKSYSILCNLKSGNIGNSPNQFKAGRIFAEFIIDTVKRQCQIEEDIIFKEVFFSSKQLYKPNTNPRKNQAKDFFSFISNEKQSSRCNLDIICR